MVDVQPTKETALMLREARRRERLPKSVFGRFSRAISFFPPARFARRIDRVSFCRLNLKHPPTAVGGIPDFCEKLTRNNPKDRSAN
jgi:hypothetical protein